MVRTEIPNRMRLRIVADSLLLTDSLNASMRQPCLIHYWSVIQMLTLPKISQCEYSQSTTFKLLSLWRPSRYGQPALDGRPSGVRHQTARSSNLVSGRIYDLWLSCRTTTP